MKRKKRSHKQKKKHQKDKTGQRVRLRGTLWWRGVLRKGAVHYLEIN